MNEMSEWMDEHQSGNVRGWAIAYTGPITWNALSDNLTLILLYQVKKNVAKCASREPLSVHDAANTTT